MMKRHHAAQATVTARQIAARTLAPDERAHVRRVLAARSRRLLSRARAIAGAASGPDPEAALVYVAQLRDACARVLAAALRPPSA